MFDHKQLKKSISCLAWMFLFCAAAYSQQESRQGVAQRSGTETAARVPGRPSDIISDNLERVAASADQILEVLYKEAGLTVEFKRLLAQDAGVSGQILEESDLTDVAVAERLRADLRARVLATRLLQRYGYLVPRLNPDSDLEAALARSGCPHQLHGRPGGESCGVRKLIGRGILKPDLQRSLRRSLLPLLRGGRRDGGQRDATQQQEKQ